MRVSVVLIAGLGLIPALAAVDQSAWADTPAWSHKITTYPTDVVTGLATDSAGNLYAAGETGGNLTRSNQGGIDAFVTTYDRNGNQLWQQQFGDGGAEHVVGVGMVNGFGPVVVGSYQNTVPMTGWIAGLSQAGGAVAWMHAVDGRGEIIPAAVTGGENGYAYVVGGGRGTVGDGIPQWSNYDGWLIKYDRAGRVVWKQTIGTPENDYATAVSYRGGAVYVAGYTRSLDTTVVDGRYIWLVRSWVARYDGNGVLQWRTELPDALPVAETATAVAAGKSGVYVAGTTDGPTAGTSYGGVDAWAAYLDAAGNLKWVQQMGTLGADDVAAAVSDAAGNLLVGGSTSGSLGGNTAGTTDGWVIKLSPAGVRMWKRQIGSMVDDHCLALSVDAWGGVGMAGDTRGDLGGPSTGTIDAWVAKFVQPALALIPGPDLRTAKRGQTATYSIILDRNSYKPELTFDVLGVPAGATAAFKVNPVKGSLTSLGVMPGKATPYGPYTMTVRALYKTKVAAAIPVYLEVYSDGAVAMSATPAAVVVPRGDAATVTVNLARTHFPDAVDLAATGLPPGVSAAWSAPSTTATSSTLTLTTQPGATPGTWPVRLTGTAKGIAIKPITVDLAITAPPRVTLAAPGAAPSVTGGQSTTVAIAVQRTDFTGNVSLALGASVPGVSASFSPSTTSGSASTLTLTASTTAASGVYTVKITGTASGVTIEPLLVPLTVVARANVRIAGAATTQTVVPGQSVSVPLTLQRGNFTGAVALAVSSGAIPGRITASFNPASVTGSSSTLTLATSTNVPVGTHLLTVSGTASGATIVPLLLTLIVTPATGVSLAVAPQQSWVTQGNAVTHTITINRNNFTGGINFSVTGLPGGATATFSANPATGASVTVTITTTAQTQIGSFSPVIVATATGVAIPGVPIQVNVNPMQVIAQARKQCNGGNSAFTLDYMRSDGTVTGTRHRFTLGGATTVTLRYSPYWFACSTTGWPLAGRTWYVRPQGSSSPGTAVPTTTTDQAVSLGAGNWELNLAETVTVPGDYYVLAP